MVRLVLGSLKDLVGADFGIPVSSPSVQCHSVAHSGWSRWNQNIFPQDNPCARLAHRLDPVDDRMPGFTFTLGAPRFALKDFFTVKTQPCHSEIHRHKFLLLRKSRLKNLDLPAVLSEGEGSVSYVGITLPSPLQMPVDQPAEKKAAQQAGTYSRPEHVYSPLPEKYGFL